MSAARRPGGGAGHTAAGERIEPQHFARGSGVPAITTMTPSRHFLAHGQRSRCKHCAASGGNLRQLQAIERRKLGGEP
jgi:hypothetical protein